MPPGYTTGSYTPSTVPGCRAPHFWLSGGRSLYDAFGPGYTLLCSGQGTDIAPFEQAMADHGVPLTVLDIEPGEHPAEYRLMQTRIIDVFDVLVAALTAVFLRCGHSSAPCPSGARRVFLLSRPDYDGGFPSGAL